MSTCWFGIVGAFGEDGEKYLRIALVENEQRLKQAVKQIDRTLRKKKRDRTLSA